MSKLIVLSFICFLHSTTSELSTQIQSSIDSARSQNELISLISTCTQNQLYEGQYLDLDIYLCAIQKCNSLDPCDPFYIARHLSQYASDTIWASTRSRQWKKLFEKVRETTKHLPEWYELESIIRQKSISYERQDYLEVYPPDTLLSRSAFYDDGISNPITAEVMNSELDSIIAGIETRVVGTNSDKISESYALEKITVFMLNQSNVIPKQLIAKNLKATILLFGDRTSTHDRIFTQISRLIYYESNCRGYTEVTYMNGIPNEDGEFVQQIDLRQFDRISIPYLLKYFFLYSAQELGTESLVILVDPQNAGAVRTPLPMVQFNVAKFVISSREMLIFKGMSVTISVSGFPISMSKDGLWELFKPFGAKSAMVERNGIKRVEGFVSFTSRTRAKEAVTAMNGVKIDGERLFVRFAHYSQISL